MSERYATFYSFDTPAGPIMVMPCWHPDSNVERPDIPLGVMCPRHNRTWYWCLDLEMAWCDGGGESGYEWHPGKLVPLDAE